MARSKKATKTSLSKQDPRETEGSSEKISGDKSLHNVKGLTDPIVQKHIQHLISDVATGRSFENSDIVGEMIVTSLKAVEARIGRGDLKLLNRAMRELRYAFKIFKAYKETRKVSIFGSARTPADDKAYIMARDFAKKLKESGYMIITGAGPGIMEAGNLGAGADGSFGVNIRLPYEQFPNKFIANSPTYIDCRYFFTRKLLFVKEAAAAAFFPGGFGTLDEAFELLTLVQTGKCDPIPLIFVEHPGSNFWQDMQKFLVEKLLKHKKISKEDLNLYKITDSIDEAVQEIVRYYSNYHSLRFVKEFLVIRLRRPVTREQLDHVNKNFKDIITGGKFEAGRPLPEEANQPEIKDMPRLIFKFNRINNGRLRMLIDFLNKP